MKIKKIPELLFFQEGPGVRKSQFTNFGVKLLNGGNINDNRLSLESTERYISEDEAYGRYNHFLVDEGDLVIASSGVLVDKFDGKSAFVKKEHLPLCMNTSTIRFKPLNKELDIKYFYFFLKTPIFKKQIQRLITGSAQLNFGPTHLKKIKVHYPENINDQKRIAQVLTDCEELIAKRKESIALLDELLKSTFLEMFGDPAQMSAKKLYKFSTHINFLTSGSRGWARFYSDKGAQFLRIQNLGFGILNEKDTQYVSPPESAESKRTKVQEGDLLISITADLGRTAVIPKNYGDAHINQHLALIRLKKSLNPIYAAFYFAMPFGNRMIQKKDKDGVKSGLNFTDIRNFDVYIPSIKEQEKFVEIVERVRKTKKLYLAHLEELENLYGRLSQDAFKGVLDLSKVVLREEFLSDLETPSIKDNLETEKESKDSKTFSETLFNLDKIDTYLENLIKSNFGGESFVFDDIKDLLFQDFRIEDYQDKYDNWKANFFAILKKENSVLEQYFDTEVGCIKFKLKDEVNQV